LYEKANVFTVILWKSQEKVYFDSVMTKKQTLGLFGYFWLGLIGIATVTDE